MKPAVRLPKVHTLRSLFDYLGRAYVAEPQPGKGINRALTFVHERGWWFVWTGSRWGLECGTCEALYVQPGRAENHRCRGGSRTSSFERAKEAENAPASSEFHYLIPWPSSERKPVSRGSRSRVRPLSLTPLKLADDILVVASAAGQPPLPKGSSNDEDLTNRITDEARDA